MENLQKFELLSKKYRNVADFLMVYVEEAHPIGGWDLNVSFCTIILFY